MFFKLLHVFEDGWFGTPFHHFLGHETQFTTLPLQAFFSETIEWPETNMEKLKSNTLKRELNTLQEINISHLGKRNIIFKIDFSGDMLVSRRVNL